MLKTKQEWLHENEKYGYADLLGRAYDTIMGNIAEDNSPWRPYRGIRPGPKRNFNGIWNWDTAFHAMGVSRWDTQLAKECILAFIQFQLGDGKYPDVIRDNGEMETVSGKPPVMAKYALLTYERDGDKAFLERCFASLKKNLSFWESSRQSEGLFYYGAEIDDPEEWDKYARWESGWDDSVRWDAGIGTLYPVDLQCYMVELYRSMTKMAELLGESKEDWEAKAEELAARINDAFFDTENGIYTDITKDGKKHSRVYSPASFMPLYIGIADREKAEACAKFAKVHFYPAMPTVAYDDPCYVGEYWRGHTWVNVAYFALKGLKDYGFVELAEEMRNTILAFARKNEDGIYEKYDADTGEGKGCPAFSWSSAFLIEFILNF